MQQQEEIEYQKAHKTRSTDEPHARRTTLPSTSHTEWGKTPSKHTTCCREQYAQPKAWEMACQTSSRTGVTAQQKVTMTKSAAPPQQTPPDRPSDSHPSRQESHHHDNCHHQATRHSPRQDTGT
uniref:Uncharacterized protein n=1 Tax=Romanomermis culicivorax TaxID=13658 RepID=A0A915KQR9_ROMCU